VFFAGAAGLCLVLTDGVAGEVRGLLFLMSGVLIQMRLLCNLFDGMVAVEGGHKTRVRRNLTNCLTGWQMFSSLSAGYAWMRVDWGPLLGWLCAVLAPADRLRASVGCSSRELPSISAVPWRSSANGVDDFRCIVSALLSWFKLHWPLIAATLILISAGTAITVVRRLLRIVRELEQK
jgi:hypothetical protein